MSIYLVLDDGEPSQVATNSGWGDFSRWIECLDGADDLRRLCEYGWNSNPSGTADELESAIKNCQPTPDQSDIGTMLLELLRSHPDAETAIINGGTAA